MLQHFVWGKLWNGKNKTNDFVSNDNKIQKKWIAIWNRGNVGRQQAAYIISKSKTSRGQNIVNNDLMCF